MENLPEDKRQRFWLLLAPSGKATYVLQALPQTCKARHTHLRQYNHTAY